MKSIFFAALVLITAISACRAQTAPAGTRDVATGLDTPWEILWGPENYIWMTERYGRISRINPETGELIALATLNDVFEDGERGLMGMALHPDFSVNPYVYTVYTYRDGSGNTLIRIIRLTFTGSSLGSPSVIMDSIKGYWNHDGSRLWIDESLKLWATIGDAASPNLAQQLDSRNGKILRMNLDGSIPDDNPFPGSYVWSMGHRNPQGLVFANGRIYSSEHGPDKDDEVNIIEKGRNYGWPNVNGFCDLESEKQFCQANNVAEPIYAWTPTLAVCGLDYYSHEKFSGWTNALLMVSLKAGKLTVMKLDETGDKVKSVENYFNGSLGRLRDLCVSPDGRVFIATSNKDGRGTPGTQDDRIIELLPQASSTNEDNQGGINYHISPLPAIDYIDFSFDGLTENLILEIYSIQGALVFSSAIRAGARDYSWDLTGKGGEKVGPGIYLARIHNNGNFIHKSIIVGN